MCGVLVLLLISPSLSLKPAQDNEAEKLFQAMEKKIVEAKAFQFNVRIETQGDTKDRVGRFKGSFLLTRENKARLKIGGNDFGERRNWEMISNGKSVYLKPYSLGTTESFKKEDTVATPQKLHDVLARQISWLGVQPMLNLGLAVSQANGPEPKLDLWDFTTGGTEKINGREAKVVRYQAGQKEQVHSLAFTLWIDTANGLPIKRIMAAKSYTITETYTDFTLDPKTDDKAFELPK